MLKQFICLSAFAFSTSVFAESVTVLHPGAEGKDALIYARTADRNFGNAEIIEVGTWDAIIRDGGPQYWDFHRALLEFDLTSALPAGAIFKSATLTLYADVGTLFQGHTAQADQTNAAWMMRVKDAWDEDLVTWNNQPATDTARKIVLEQSVSADQNYVLDVSGWVSFWLANPSENHGFMLVPQAEAPVTSLAFGSSDEASGTLRPKLEIRYEMPGTAPVDPTHGKSVKFKLTDGVLALEEPATGSILDENGQVLHSFNYAAPATVDLTWLSPGNYVLQFAGVPWHFPFKVKAK